MLRFTILGSFLVALAIAFPAHGQVQGDGQRSLLVPAQYQDPSRPVHHWQQPRSGGWYSHRQQQYHAYQQHRLEQERRWRAYQEQRRREAQRRALSQQQRYHNQWHSPYSRWQSPPPARRLDPLRQQPPEPRTEPRQAAPDERDGGSRPHIEPAAPPVVTFANSEEPGTIIIDAEARKLYYTLNESEAFAYPVSVGREGFGWYGTETVSRVASWPDWYPPESMRQRQPELPRMMTGGINNPLGARAIYLGDTLYRIHGTNEESSIGQASSSGCFRMLNAHVVHLAERVDVGAKVRVVERWPTGGMARAGESG